jgi:hypothetical protein
MGHTALILIFQAGTLALSQTCFSCSMGHQALIKTSILGVPSCLLPSLDMEDTMLSPCLVAMVAPTRAVLQDAQDPGVL